MENFLVALIVIAAALYLGRNIFKSAAGRGPSCCGEKETDACQGCACTPQEGAAGAVPEEGGKDSLTKVVLTGVMALFCMVLELHLIHLPADLTRWLGLAAVLTGGWPLARNAWRGLRKKKLNVDALVIVAAGAALSLGEYLEAATVVFILLLGEQLEAYTVRKAHSAVKGLAHLLPERVRIKEGGHGEREIRAGELKEGMVLIIKPGERIAVDGVITAGKGVVDQSPITGEGMPVEKAAGDEVYSGTLSVSGAFQVRATRVGKQTTVANIKRLVEEAKREKAPIQQLVNRFAGWFVPAVICLAGLVYLGSGDLRRAITVLIVTCPCAFVLATPIAVVAAIGGAARRGVLIKGGMVLEACARLNSFVFDKTGTLTYGQPRIVKINTVCGRACTKEDTLTFAAVAEKLSQHPLAEAVLQKAKDWELMISTPDDFTVKHGQGVLAQHEDIKIVLGKRSLLAENGIELLAELEGYIREREGAGETVLLVAHHKQVCGVISLLDSLRGDAPATISRLKKLGIDQTIALYTGDNYEVARAMATRLGINDFEANLLPEQKVAKIKELTERGYQVGMVGDGINDAPALAASHVGIAMGVRGSEVAVNAADIALLTDDLSKIPQLIELGKKTFVIIKQNIWFALLFNALMLTLASLGIINMITGAVFHQVSALLVILNSMRLISGADG